jgi:hypothetical protein
MNIHNHQAFIEYLVRYDEKEEDRGKAFNHRHSQGPKRSGRRTFDLLWRAG